MAAHTVAKHTAFGNSFAATIGPANFYPFQSALIFTNHDITSNRAAFACAVCSFCATDACTERPFRQAIPGTFSEAIGDAKCFTDVVANDLAVSNYADGTS